MNVHLGFKIPSPHNHEVLFSQPVCGIPRTHSVFLWSSFHMEEQQMLMLKHNDLSRISSRNLCDRWGKVGLRRVEMEGASVLDRGAWLKPCFQWPHGAFEELGRGKHWRGSVSWRWVFKGWQSLSVKEPIVKTWGALTCSQSESLMAEEGISSRLTGHKNYSVSIVNKWN